MAPIAWKRGIKVVVSVYILAGAEPSKYRPLVLTYRRSKKVGEPHAYATPGELVPACAETFTATSGVDQNEY